jgi:hypothetical protein
MALHSLGRVPERLESSTILLHVHSSSWHSYMRVCKYVQFRNVEPGYIHRDVAWGRAVGTWHEATCNDLNNVDYA